MDTLKFQMIAHAMAHVKRARQIMHNAAGKSYGEMRNVYDVYIVT